MTVNPANSIAIQLHFARKRLGESEARATRLALLIERLGSDDTLTTALARSLTIVRDLNVHQQQAIASLEATEQDALRFYLATALEDELLFGRPFSA